MLTFSISQWQSWAVHLPDKAAWEQWAKSPASPQSSPASAPRLDFLPPMQRRRLSAMAREVFACAWPLASPQTGSPMPLVFASRHGETSRSFPLLQTLAVGEPLSPTSFCLSVHNAIAAQWSILRGETVESVALSAEDDGLEHAFIEAGLLLAAGYKQVLVVVAEESPPEAYTPWIPDVPFSYVAAFVVCAGQDWSLTLNSPNGAVPRTPQNAHHHSPNPLSLVRHLLLQTPSWQHASHHSSRIWQWAQQATTQLAKAEQHSA